jgi:RHS repeat-associated protein
MIAVVLLEETNSSGVAQADYIYLDGRPVAVLNGSTLYYLHDDRLGTPQLATDSSQAVAWQATYQPFGQASVSGTLTQNLRFPGQYFDVESGWNHNGFRNYIPDLGRYAEPDPLGRTGSGNNLYIYVSNDPIVFSDPFGLKCNTPDKGQAPKCIPRDALTLNEQVALEGLSVLAKAFGGVRAIGMGGSFVFSSPVFAGGGASAQALLIADYTGQEGVYWSVTGGPTVGEKGFGGIFGFQYMTSTLNSTVTIQDVVNSSISLGVGAGDGFAVSLDYSPQTGVVTETVGPGAGGWGGATSLNVASGFIPICQ